MKCKTREILNKLDNNAEKCIQFAILIDTNYCSCELCVLDKKERIKRMFLDTKFEETIDFYTENQEEFIEIIKIKRLDEIKRIIEISSILNYLLLDSDYENFETNFIEFLQNYIKEI